MTTKDRRKPNKNKEMTLRDLFERHSGEDASHFETINKRFESQDVWLKKISEQNEQQLEMMKQTKEMWTVYTNGGFLVKVAKWIFGIAIALGGAYLMLKSIFFK